MNISGKLYIVATPIGNLSDITLRAIETLKTVDFIAAEDTRHSGKLLQHYTIKTPMLSLHEHNENVEYKKLLTLLTQGKSIALISDAGTPLISDPGYRLVHEAFKLNILVVPIPGASAIIAALSVSGLPSDRFAFEGFLPAKQAARIKLFEGLANESRTMVFYESPHRIMSTLNDMLAVFGDAREVVLARELTKRFETILADKIRSLRNTLLANPEQQKGEFVLLLAGVHKEDKSALSEVDLHVLKVLLSELTVMQAAHLAAKITGKKKNKLYQIALEMQKKAMV